MLGKFNGEAVKRTLMQACNKAFHNLSGDQIQVAVLLDVGVKVKFWHVVNLLISAVSLSIPCLILDFVHFRGMWTKMYLRK